VRIDKIRQENEKEGVKLNGCDEEHISNEQMTTLFLQKGPGQMVTEGRSKWENEVRAIDLDEGKVGEKIDGHQTGQNISYFFIKEQFSPKKAVNNTHYLEQRDKDQHGKECL
jgi:hypothetical protein